MKISNERAMQPGLLLAGLMLAVGASSTARGQSSQPLNIPLQLTPSGDRLAISVGIAGQAPRLYVFDTGSSVFASANNSSIISPTSTTGPLVNGAPSSIGLPTGVPFSYGAALSSNSITYNTNIVQVPSVQFYNQSNQLISEVSGSTGFKVATIYERVGRETVKVAGQDQTTTKTTSFSQDNGYSVTVQPPSGPSTTTYYNISTPPEPSPPGQFYGTFGAGYFLNNGVGSVLGQTLVSGANIKQGYVVAANGQANPYSSANVPVGSSGINVAFGGASPVAITNCSPCVTVGITPQMLGQFMPISASNTGGLIGWTDPGAQFSNPYDGSRGNNASTKTMGINLNVTLTQPGQTIPDYNQTNPGLLDTGTVGLTLAKGTTSFYGNGVTLGVTGTTPSSSAVPGLTTSTAILSDSISVYQPLAAGAAADTNTIGLSFFLQNSVLFDLQDQAVGYTPFFVTDAQVQTTSNGSLVVNPSNLPVNVPIGLAGEISGAGGVYIGSGGALQLSAANSYTGITTITGMNGATPAGQLYISGPGSIATSSGVANNGVLDISRAWAPVSIQALSGSGRVVLGGQNLTITGLNGTFSGSITDDFPTNDASLGDVPNLGSVRRAGGSVTIAGGKQKLTGVNTYTGGTMVTGGATLGINADAALGNTSGGLTLNNGMLGALSDFTVARQVTLGPGGGAFDTNGFNVVLGTAVAGPGGLTKNGLGMLTLSGDNSYAGGTTVNDGILQVAPGASLPTTGPLTVNGGTLDFNGNNATIGSLSGVGGTIALGTGTLTVAEQASTTFAGILTGTGGLTLQGPGMLSLTGANTYTGPTSIIGGRLAINGSITSNVTVGAAGNLGGSGTIFGTVTNNGIVAPGNSIGTLTVNGAYTQAAGSSYQVETNAAGQADRLNVAGGPGTATLAGGDVVVTAASGVYAPSTTYTILNATGGVTGAYAGASSLYPFLQASLAYDANNVYLTLKPGGFGIGGATPNQSAVGRALDQSVAGSSGDFATVIGTMATYTLGQGQAALASLSGQNYSGFGTANLASGLLFMNMMGQQMSLARGGVASGTRVAVARACEATPAEACDGEAATPWSLWGTALGGTGSVAGNANAGTLTYNAGGFAAGADYRFDPRFLAGFALGYVSGNQWASGFSGQGTTSSYQASLYASFTQGAFYLDGLAGYGYNDNQMTRQIVLPNLAARLAQGRTGANQLLGQLEAGYRVGIHEQTAASVTPFARFQGSTNSQFGFTESGAGSLNLNVAPQTTGSARSTLGAEFAGAFGPDGREKLAVQIRLGWAHEYADTTRPVTASFAGAPGANFTVFGAAPQRDGAAFSLAANTVVAPGTSLYVRYDGETGSGTTNHVLNGGLRLTW